MDLYTLQLRLCVFLTVQVSWGLDQVTLLNPPQEPRSDHLQKILYSCDRPASVQLYLVVSFETSTTSTLQLREWSCIPGDPKIRTVKLKLPDWLVYQADGIIPDTQWVLSCMLLVSVRYSEGFVAVQDVADLQLKPFFNRPVKQHQLCFAWSTEMLHLTPRFSKRQCAVEQETVHLLSSIYASTGEKFGITKALEPFTSEFLEHIRRKAISFPWCVFSIWIFVTRYCQQSLCGVFHHIDSQNNYDTPALFLTKAGLIHVQVKGEDEKSFAFHPSVKVPLNKWCQIRLTLIGRGVTISMVCIDEGRRDVHSEEHRLEYVITLDDTEGYFVIGGGKYIQGVDGYYGPVVYYRNRIPPHRMSEVVLPDVIRTVNLGGWLQACHAFHLDMTEKITGYTFKARQGTEFEPCYDAFYEWMIKYQLPSPSQCGLWEETLLNRRQAVKLTKFLVLKHGARGVCLPAVGRALYSLSLHKLSRASCPGVVSRILPLLLQAGCLADNRALYMASVFYSAGLGVKEQPAKAWLLALQAAQKDDRLALLNLGHMHHHGLHGHPTDIDLAYAYYANIAEQTVVDRHNPTAKQTFVESVYLNNDELLQVQTNEDHHIFQWLKLQARKGTTEAEQTIARMLFWGQQGVSPNIEKAVKHYERGAVELKDPVSMYDYGIVLLQGQGVEKDVPKAFTFLKKATEQGFAPAMNALGWYYEQYENDYHKAMELWERADLLNNPDAALNLGVIHSQGLYPGKAADQFTAYQYYMKAADRGQIRGTVLLCEFWTTGLPGRVNRRPLDALLRVKWAAEHNGYLGTVLRTALNSYLKNDIFNSLLYYTMAAECGFAAAQFNVAYLCEKDASVFLEPDYASSCMWRHYNLTSTSRTPNTYAFIKLGDMLYEGHGHRQKDLLSAAEKYTQAALRKEPQAWYNLGLLAEEGFRLPLSVLAELGLSELFLEDNSVLLSSLYKRCRDSGNTDSYLPCSFALFKVYLQSFQKEYSSAIKIFTAVAMVVAPTIFLIIFRVLRRPVPVQSRS